MLDPQPRKTPQNRRLTYAEDPLNHDPRLKAAPPLIAPTTGVPEAATGFLGRVGQPPPCPQSACIYNVRTDWYSGCIHRKNSMPIARTGANAQRGETINLRASQRQKLLIDRAAQALGRSRSDFMLDTACREAESILLDRRYFFLSEDEFKKFAAMLDRPPRDNPKLRRLLQTRAPWDR